MPTSRLKAVRRRAPNQSRRAVLAVLTRHSGQIAAMALAALAGAFTEAAFLVVVTALAMAVVQHNDVIGPYAGVTVTIQLALTLASGLLVLRLLFNLLAATLSVQLTTSVAVDERRRLTGAFLESSWALQQAQPSGRLQELLTSFVQKSTITVQAVASAITSGLSLFGFLAVSFFVDAVATLAVGGLLVLFGAVLSPLRRYVSRLGNAWRTADLTFATTVSELSSLGLEMQTFGVEAPFAAEIDRSNVKAATTQRRAQVFNSAQSHLYATLAYASVLGGVALANHYGISNLAVVGAVLVLMMRALGYGQSLAASMGMVAAYSPFTLQVQEACQQFQANPARSGRAMPAGAAPLSVTDVSYSYPNGRLGVADVTFEVRRGEVTGIIGPSGAGKSTIAQLLLGLRWPDQGRITASSDNLRDVERAWWTDKVAFVPQDALFIAGSVSENIRFFRDGISDADIRSAAQLANLLPDIERMEDGFDTHLGARGSQLSGGQRQRLSIARALAAHPEMLILDEPTSALDGKSESVVTEVLAELSEDVTIIIIAHRMSTLSICDRIIVLEDGRVTGAGTPQGLWDTNAFYRNSMMTAGLKPPNADVPHAPEVQPGSDSASLVERGSVHADPTSEM